MALSLRRGHIFSFELIFRNRSYWSRWSQRRGRNVLYSAGYGKLAEVRCVILSLSCPSYMYHNEATINKISRAFFSSSIATIMRDSGCEVPEYMLAMKKHSKKERRKLEHSAPKRERISTVPTYKRRKRKSHANKMKSEPEKET